MSTTKQRSASKDEAAARRAASRAALAKANKRREVILALKADARVGRLGVAALLADDRAADLEVLNVLTMRYRCTLRIALDALLATQINGARPCGELSEAERIEPADAVSNAGRRTALPRRAVPGNPEGIDRALDRVLRDTHRAAPVVELAPSEFAAARTGLEDDPLLLRMVDRLVHAVRLYAEQDDGGVRARVVAEQWIRYCNYRGKVARGECPPPAQRGPAVLE